MTGPLFSTLHPHRRRARLLLPFAAAIMLGQLACTSDQPAEPTSSIQAAPVVATTGPHPRAKLARTAMATSQPKALVTLKASPSFGIAQATSGTGPSVLILADTDVVATSALAASLADSGVQVTIRPAPEYSWDGTNPSLSGFDVVVHLNGATYDIPLSSDAQSALTTFVANGGGFVAAQWNGYEPQPDLNSLVLLGMGNDPEGPSHNCTACDVTFERLPAGEGHPVLAGLPASFTVPADGHDAGPAASFATVLMQVSSGGPAVLVRDFGSGRVVNFSFAPNYPWNDEGLLHDLVTLQDPTVQHLYLNAVRWAAGSGEAVAVPQTIDFAPLANKVYGDAAFSISASASSNLPVNFTASGDCGVVGSTVTVVAAGTCTITAHQAGNDEYTAAEDVSRSFTIVKATAVITVGTEYTFDGTVKLASLSTDPNGLSGVTATYSLNGLTVTQPINAGVYQVFATLDNPNYQAAPATGTLTIHPAAPVIHWTPAPLSSGTPLGPSQLNATATGLGGVLLVGNAAYTPAAPTSFEAGTYTLSVTFTPNDHNYAVASKTVSITVSGTMKFSGFFAPIRNMPFVNTVTAGSAIPVKFTIGGYRGLRVLQMNPSSVDVACPASAPVNAIRPTVASSSGLKSLGYSYTYVWKTSSAWGGSCRKFVLTLSDGSTHEALFRFTAAPRTQAKRILGR
jgi:hypothetical protein